MRCQILFSTICMKCQILFSRKNKKNIINVLPVDLAQRVAKIKINHLVGFSFVLHVSAAKVWFEAKTCV